VFCTAIEQRILGLAPQPAVERIAEAADVVQDGGSLSVKIGDIHSQIAYLQATREIRDSK
jgi:hypothetical protein